MLQKHNDIISGCLKASSTSKLSNKYSEAVKYIIDQ